MATVKSTAITKKLFGGVFNVDGSGHYPGLELINLVVCCAEGTLPSTEKVHVIRAAHDFARMLISEKLEDKRKNEVLLDPQTATVVTHLLRCLELEVPNIVKTKGWERTHFFPYTRSLVHWDARKARQSSSEVQLERRYLRGAGAYAFSVLRHDPDQTRLEETRVGFEQLYPTNRSSPLELLAETLRKQGKSDSIDNPSFDQVEFESILLNDEWENLYRDGTRNILSHTNLPSVQRVRAIMNWTSIWLVLLEGARALKANGEPKLVVVVDCAGSHSQLRRAAQKCLKTLTGVIEQVSRDEALAQGEVSAPQISKIRGFFSNTAAAGGLLNAWKGRRHFTLRLTALEALVMAAVPSGKEMEYESFLSDWLYERCHIVSGREAAANAGMLMDFDGTIFEENERRLAEQMRSAGLLIMFSDATRMVSPGGKF